MGKGISTMRDQTARPDGKGPSRFRSAMMSSFLDRLHDFVGWCLGGRHWPFSPRGCTSHERRLSSTMGQIRAGCCAVWSRCLVALHAPRTGVRVRMSFGLLGTAGAGWGWLGMAGDGWGWLVMAGDGWGWLGMAGDGSWLGIALGWGWLAKLGKLGTAGDAGDHDATLCDAGWSNWSLRAKPLRACVKLLDIVGMPGWGCPQAVHLPFGY
eukprot:3558108-Prymnesium_polylepis.1